MSGVYCGRCGSASGVGARYCRLCGGEIVMYVGEVELAGDESARPARPAKAGTVPPPSPPVPASGGSGRVTGVKRSNDGGERRGDPPDPPRESDVFEKLRRLRTSGRLLLDEGMRNDEAISDIMTHALEEIGAETPKMRPTSMAKDPEGVAAPPAERAEVPPRGAGSATKTTITPITATRVVPPAADLTAEGIPAGRGGAAAGAQGPSRVLATASGLEPPGRMSFGLRAGIVLMVIIFAGAVYLAFRERVMRSLDGGGGTRDLMRPEDLSARYIGLGMEERGRGNYEAALDWFRKANVLTPNNPRAMSMLAQTYGEAQQTDEALETYLKLVRLYPEDLESRLQVASIYQRRNEWGLALREYRRIIALDQGSPQAAVALEVIELREGKPSGERKTIKRRPAPSPTLLSGPDLPTPSLGQKEITLVPPSFVANPGLRAPEGLNADRNGEKPDPSVIGDARKDRGLRYLNIREYRAAIKEFLIALQMTPEDRDLFYYIGSSYYGLQEYAMAHDYYRRVDRGRYLSVAQSGARRTEKAAAEYRRRMSQSKAESTEDTRGAGPRN